MTWLIKINNRLSCLTNLIAKELNTRLPHLTCLIAYHHVLVLSTKLDDLTRNIIPLLSILRLEKFYHASMSSRQTRTSRILANRVNHQGHNVMIACNRCALKQKECRLSFFFRKYNECIRARKKCELATFKVNFIAIDRAMKKLKKQKVKTKVLQIIVVKQLRVSQTKLQKLRQ